MAAFSIAALICLAGIITYFIAAMIGGWHDGT